MSTKIKKINALIAVMSAIRETHANHMVGLLNEEDGNIQIIGLLDAADIIVDGMAA